MRLSLGGVRDEAEIRGHRRTYVGAMPGKIIMALKRAKSSNPLFCLDEIDKMSSDYRGDPASALLEVLDPEQNKTFNDHYLDIDYDLSKVFFITTANSLHNIPAPLQDRMEIIELSSYLEVEKKHIARDFLLPRQIREHGLKSGNISLPEETLTEVIRSYTREAGVRNLEREIGALCRKTAIKLVEEDNLDQCVTIAPDDLETYLGVKKYRMDENEKKEPEMAQEPPKPEDYSRYMGTLNRIYRRNNNPQRKKLGDGITSLKKGQQPAAPAPEPGKKDRSFLVVAGGAIVLMAILYFIKLL